MADSFGKREREKKKRTKKLQKQEDKAKRKSSDGKSTDNFAYVDRDGNITSEKPDKTLNDTSEDTEDTTKR